MGFMRRGNRKGLKSLSSLEKNESIVCFEKLEGRHEQKLKKLVTPLQSLDVEQKKRIYPTMLSNNCQKQSASEDPQTTGHLDNELIRVNRMWWMKEDPKVI